jgi:putative ABC transport system permease protein
MLKNYFKIAWRNLIKNKGFTAINVIGLSLGIGCFIIIAMYVTDELSYDRFHEKADNIYRVHSDISFGGTELNMAVSSDPMGETLKKDYPEVEAYVRLFGSSGSKLIKKGTEYINETAVAHADSTLFNVFTLPVLHGDPKTALTKPNTVVITKTAAERYFDSADKAVGQALETDDNTTTLYEVTAVIEDLPKNSHFDIEFFFSMHNINYNFGNWGSHNFHTYIVLRDGTDHLAFNDNFLTIINNYFIPQIRQFVEIESLEAFENQGNRLKYYLFPLTDIHLKSKETIQLGANGNIQYVYIFSAAALFILLLACINFMNLTTARSSGRAREVGIRKVLGTEKKSLISQFLTESTLVAFLSLLIGLLFVRMTLGWFNDIAGKEMEIATLFQSQSLILLILAPFAIGILAGLYPAFFMSSFQPITVLKGKLFSNGNKNYLRNFLVVFQFTTSIILIIGTIVIYKQLNHIQKTNVGFSKDQMLVVDNTGIPNETRSSLQTEISQLTDIKSSSFAGYLPVANSSRSDTTFSMESVMTINNGFNMQYWGVDYDYIDNLGMEIIDGRNFSREFGTDSTALILNETAVKLTGFKDPVGRKLYSSDQQGNTITYTIIGVIKNFNYASLRNEVGALCFELRNNSWASAYRFNTADVSNMVNIIEEKYKAVAPGMPFEYSFLDESFDQMYRQEQRVGRVAITFAILAIIIACLGLLGLATYIAEQRTKEIGVRKVLGASVPNIIKMLSMDFVKLVTIAFLLATPIAFWFMSKWLQGFAYKIDLSWWIFLGTGILALIVALTTLSFQAIRAALANPVISLRTE